MPTYRLHFVFEGDCVEAVRSAALRKELYEEKWRKQEILKTRIWSRGGVDRWSRRVESSVREDRESSERDETESSIMASSETLSEQSEPPFIPIFPYLLSNSMHFEKIKCRHTEVQKVASGCIRTELWSRFRYYGGVVPSEIRAGAIFVPNGETLEELKEDKEGNEEETTREREEKEEEEEKDLFVEVVMRWEDVGRSRRKRRENVRK